MLPQFLSDDLHSFHAMSGCHHLVSGSISHPDKGSFQLSLTVLVRYRSWENVFRIRSRCLPNSGPISNGPYSRTYDLNLKNPYLRDYNPLRYGIPAQFQLKKKRNNTTKVLITPHLPHITMRNSVYSTPFSLAVTNSIAYCFLLLRLLRCFSSAGSRSPKKGSTQNKFWIGSPIR